MASVIVVVISLVFVNSGGPADHPKACQGSACASSSAKSVAPLARLRYRTVDREVGYFEGTITFVNHGKQPLRAWTLAFSYPGADIHNIWEAVLQQRGQDVVIVNKPGAAPIAPGHSFAVQFGGAGRPSKPTNCRLDGAPCTFG